MMNREKQKKEQKTFEYIENPEQIEGFDKIPVPEDLDQRVRAGIEEGKKRRKKTAFRKTAKIGMGIAPPIFAQDCGSFFHRSFHPVTTLQNICRSLDKAPSTF